MIKEKLFEKNAHSKNKCSSKDKCSYYNSTTKAFKAKSKLIAHSHTQAKAKNDKSFPEEDSRTKMEDEIKELWLAFIDEFNYKAYLHPHLLFPNTKGDSNEAIDELVPIEVKYRIFLLNNQIEIQINNKLKSFTNEGSFLLSYMEIWLMHIKLLIEQRGISLLELVTLFSSAISMSSNSIASSSNERKGESASALLLFSFFIIYTLEYIEQGKDLPIASLIGAIPKSFNDLWRVHRLSVISIVKEGCYAKLFQLNLTKSDKASVLKAKPQSYQTPELKRKRMCFHKEFDIVTDLKNARVIDRSIGDHGNYALIELSSNVQRSIGHKYIFTPIKSSIKNKAEVSSDLKEVNEKYKGILYHPYEESIAFKINDNERLSFG